MDCPHCDARDTLEPFGRAAGWFCCTCCGKTVFVHDAATMGAGTTGHAPPVGPPSP